ncbi:hypothetical protein GZL_05868 [Streptomyces sp. 769]|nr:hypothetical protein GZL_05868 [Streptomyces sp. 769]
MTAPAPDRRPAALAAPDLWGVRPHPATDPQCSRNILKAISGSPGFPRQFRGKIFEPASKRGSVLCGRGKLNEMRGRKAAVVPTIAAALRADRPGGIVPSPRAERPEVGNPGAP